MTRIIALTLAFVLSFGSAAYAETPPEAAEKLVEAVEVKDIPADGAIVSIKKAAESEVKEKIEEAIAEPSDEAQSAMLNENHKYDTVYGKGDAPVTVVEYASLSCSHCANFYNSIFPELKEKYIDTGKVRLVYRHFPLNLPALRAAMVTECVGNVDKKKLLIGALFKAQDQWAYSKDEKEFSGKLVDIGKVVGLKESAINECFKKTDLEEELLARQVAAGKVLKVKNTPTIFINGEMLKVEKTKDNVIASIDLALFKAEKAAKEAKSAGEKKEEKKAE